MKVAAIVVFSLFVVGGIAFGIYHVSNMPVATETGQTSSISITHSPYVGTWKRDAGQASVTMVISSDGTGAATGAGSEKFVWREVGNHIVISPPNDPSGRQQATAEVGNDGQSLSFTIPGGYKTILIRQQ